jgi:hypothetical protein
MSLSMLMNDNHEPKMKKPGSVRQHDRQARLRAVQRSRVAPGLRPLQYCHLQK